jgi:hypothetical protein
MSAKTTNLETVDVSTSITQDVHHKIWKSMWHNLKNSVCDAMPNFDKRDEINNLIAVPVNSRLSNIERSLNQECVRKL